MTEIYNRKSLKTRKEQTCLGCLEIIPSGSDAVNNTGNPNMNFMITISIWNAMSFKTA